MVEKLKAEVLELEKEKKKIKELQSQTKKKNKIKKILNCHEIYIIKANFTNLKSKYNDLLAEFTKTKKLLDYQVNPKEKKY